VKHSKKAPKQGIGLYTYAQEKNTTPFQYLAHIVVGSVFVLLGMALGYTQYQSPARSTGGLITSVAFIVIGVFIGHAGAIFWHRRLWKRSSGN
jgi:hypothetical protein